MADAPTFKPTGPRRLTIAPQESRDGGMGDNIVVPGAGVELGADGGSPVDAGSADGGSGTGQTVFADSPVLVLDEYKEPSGQPFKPRYASTEKLLVCDGKGRTDSFFNGKLYTKLGKIWEAPRGATINGLPFIMTRPVLEPKLDDWFTNLSDPTLLPTLFHYNNFVAKEPNPASEEHELIDVHYALCRSANRDEDGFYRVYSYELNTKSDLPMGVIAKFEGKQVKEEMTLYRIMQVIVGGKLNDMQYYVETMPNGEKRLYLTPEALTLDQAIKNIEDSSELSAQEKTEIKAIFAKAKAESGKANPNGNHSGGDPLLLVLKIGGVTASIVVSYAIIHGIFVYQRRGIALMEKSIAIQEQMLRHYADKIDPQSFLKNVTEEAAKPDYSRLIGSQDVQENMLDISAQRDQPHIFVSGAGDIAGTGDSAGLGKSENIRAHLHTRALEGYEVFEMSGSSLGSATAKYVGKPEEAVEAMFEYINKAIRAGKRIVIWVREAHVLKGLGTAEGHPTDVVQLMLDKLERLNEGSYFIFDTNKPHGVDGSGGLLDDEAFLRRVSVALVSSPSIEEAVQIMKPNVARYVGETMTISSTEIRTLVLLSPITNGGALPARGFKLLDRITSHLRRKNFTGPITEEMIIERVAAIAKIDVAMVRSFLELADIAIEEYGFTPEQVKELLGRLRKKGYYIEGGKMLWIETLHKEMQETGFVRRTSSQTGGNGPKEPPKTPPTSGGEPPSAGTPISSDGPPPAAGASGESEETGAKRIFIAGKKPPTLLETAMNPLKLPLFFGGLRYATHQGWVPSWMEPTAGVGIGALAVWVDRYALIDLGLMVAPYELSKNITTVVMDGVGLPAGHAENDTASVLGGFAGMAAIVRATGGAQLWREAGKTVVKRMVENGVMGGLRETAVIGAKSFAEDAGKVLSIGGRTMVPRLAGGALVVVTMSSCGDEPHKVNEWQYDNKEIRNWISWAKTQFDIPWENISLNNLNEKLADGRTGMEHNLARVSDKRARAFLTTFLSFAYEQITNVFDTDEVRARRAGLEAFKNRQVSGPKPAPQQQTEEPSILVALKK